MKLYKLEWDIGGIMYLAANDEKEARDLGNALARAFGESKKVETVTEMTR